MRKIFLIHLLFVFILQNILAQTLEEKLETLSTQYNFNFKALNTDTFFTEKYVLMIPQPDNHQNAESETFNQRVILSHKGFKQPVVFITEGYTAGYAMNSQYIHELSSILNANQICVEHRYFGESVPERINWDQLTVYNAASDHHRVVEILRQIYSENWINTGISKGGQTAMYHRYYYPNDVEVTVGYVCPLNFSTEDQRVYRFLQNVGDSICRQKILDFQYEMLSNKTSYLKEFEKLADKKNNTYSMGIMKAYELTVLEYSFAFWQWGTECSTIPVNTQSPEEMVNHLNQVAGIDWVSDQGVQRLLPFFYQALTEIGFYGYDIGEFPGLTSFTKNPTFEFTAPQGTEINYNPIPMQEVDSFIRHEANNMIFIYGEDDPWSSTSVDLTYSTNSIKIVKPGGDHGTRINNLPESQKKQVLDTLNKWLE